MTANQRKRPLRGWISQMGLRNKIVLCIYAVMFPVLIASVVYIMANNYDAVYKDATVRHVRATQSVVDEITYLQQDMVDIMTYFSVNTHIRNVLMSDPERLKDVSLFWQSETPIEFMKDVLAIKTQLRTVILYPENGLTPFYVSSDGSVHDTNLAKVRELPMYVQAVQSRGDIVWTLISAQERGFYLRNRTDKIVASRVIFDLSKRRKLGFLAISMDADTFRRILSNQLLSPGEGIIVLSPSGEVLFEAGQWKGEVAGALMGDGVALEMAESPEAYHCVGDSYVFVNHEATTGITVCYLSPRAEWDARIWSGLQLPLLMALALLVCTWPLSAIVSRALSRSTKELSAAMQKFRQGDFAQQVKIRSGDEIGQMSLAFNQMATDVRELIDKNYVMALRERESELDALQAQINPHFLYNVMDSLYWQAEESGENTLAEDILALSQLFRLLLSQGQSEIPVASEVALIGYYLQIQKMRFLSRLSYEIDVEESMMEYRLPKLTLQPFVENAIVHGLEKSVDGGFVKIHGRLEGEKMIFSIQDNGVGMRQEDADRMLRADESGNYARARIGHYAISNIKERLALRYGESAKLDIRSDPSVGTTVWVTLPAEGAGGGDAREKDL